MSSLFNDAGIKVLVTGGRFYTDYTVVKNTLREIAQARGGIALIINGGAGGADGLSRQFAEEFRIPYLVYPARWRALGNAAGPERNGRMLRESKPDIVVVFPGDRGTADCKRQAEALGYELKVVSGPYLGNVNGKAKR